MRRLGILLSSLAVACTLCGNSFAQARRPSAVNDQRVVWLVDADRGCVSGWLSRAVWQLAQLRPVLRLNVRAAKDGDVTIYKIFYEGRTKPITGMSVYFTDELYCARNYYAVLSDMDRVKAGQKSTFRSNLLYTDQNEFFFPGYYSK